MRVRNYSEFMCRSEDVYALLQSLKEGWKGIKYHVKA